METNDLKSKWSWKMDYCKDKGVSPSERWAWEEAEIEYAKYIENKGELMNENAMFLFKLRLNIEEWGEYKRGDVAEFYISLLSEDNGLIRYPIDERWDVITCKLIKKQS